MEEVLTGSLEEGEWMSQTLAAKGMNGPELTVIQTLNGGSGSRSSFYTRSLRPLLGILPLRYNARAPSPTR